MPETGLVALILLNFLEVCKGDKDAKELDVFTFNAEFEVGAMNVIFYRSRWEYGLKHVLAMIGLLAVFLFGLWSYIMGFYRKYKLLEELLRQKEEELQQQQQQVAPEVPTPAQGPASSSGPEQHHFNLIMGLGARHTTYMGFTAEGLRTEMRNGNLKGVSMVKADLATLLAMHDIVLKQQHRTGTPSVPLQGAPVPEPAVPPAPPPPPVAPMPPPSYERPPTAAQLRFAWMLAAKPGATEMAQEVLVSEVACSAYIDRNRHLMR